ncbi:cyclic nucleotide-binding domain-containing protein [Photobacterium phosphoreum]|uniref:Cyclic nucleotide-binding domain-containing protein n=1 Tax=Photobacterium phosphoreum TaxID=659 RepID=A0AAW5A2I2_PHOPO|nr:Crp/Fnr family transcriptional regulator [Photobacterium phosphoreum]MCD9476957.1 cyclic nucleotide-binding domain-containing protein [Photobacterium phosphoreum]MCD9492812.1 cyclic nucleotide-binding domain-containing protein [Photobacterium phosphoreum]MCD9520635.1 cyclic nucleotide-binding domain-containing protein [Photobacterium phosphoreum]MCF2177725.1 cyclic nucleotide-binding domain-containing protein [Photobacterium phosphoreum]MCF2192049.1 cyclic nucleotide-binding domain-containi
MFSNNHVELIAFLTQLGADATTISDVIAVAEPLELPTRHILLHQGQRQTYCYFLLNGLCHACYLTDQGKQFSKEFYWDQDVIIGFESLINNEPSAFLLETLSASQLIMLPITLFQQWRQQQHPLYQALLERQLLHKEHKERFMLMHTPEQRLQLFCDHFPELVGRITDYQLASYLGITSISLSRIKKRIASDDIIDKS